MGEIISSSQVGATLLMVIGAITIVYKGGVNLNLGDILVLFSPLMFQISHAIAKKLLNKGTYIFLILAGRQLYGGLMLLFFSFIMNKSIINLFNFNSLTSALYLGLFLSAISFCWFSSIKKFPFLLHRLFTINSSCIFTWVSFFLKETISIQQYLGFFFIVGGMIWQASSLNKKQIANSSNT